MPVKNRPNTGFEPGSSGNPAGRPKGSPNKTTALLKDAILRAAELAGGEGDDKSPGGMIAYLEKQAKENPGPFLGLLGKVLPMQVTGENGGALVINVTIGGDGAANG